MQANRILVVDDEREIAELIRDYLEEEHYEVAICADGGEAWRRFGAFRPHLAVLDVMLPGIDGLELCRRIRAESAIPVIMLSARKEEADKILGLGLGADDYVVKPFSPKEVVARVKAQLRRFGPLSSLSAERDVLTFGELEIEPQAYAVRVGETAVPLTAKEFEVLRLLALHPNQVLSRQQIYDRVWGVNEYGDLNTVTIHIQRIRQKIERDCAGPRCIRTIWGVGYKFGGPAYE
ncbi:response regulator transcription factor [Saccharibacillus sp. CPCC 101409]|uniref:response regulator transcription factor n=1 Tax=Saccharibacillus sp. CPCC 101409 TaxID=3058041 RepID=UPI002670E088|nr:response regulator transcription factor [Saccharibacillus sp. CPCC 101409]MDO3411717.1 response regulator transcription factor [Saccharibacillus sp. CPCC 101409]